MKIEIEITEDQQWALSQEFRQISNPYGNRVVHIGYVNSVSTYLNDEQLERFIKARNELSELGLLHFISISNGTLRFYEITKIGQMFCDKINR